MNSRNLAFAVVALPAAAGAHPICNWLFRCGCGWFTAAACNVHHATGPHCPWCTTRWAFPVVIATWLIAAAISIRIVERKQSLPLSVLAGALGACTAMLASGAVSAWISGYPRFLWW